MLLPVREYMMHTNVYTFHMCSTSQPFFCFTNHPLLHCGETVSVFWRPDDQTTRRWGLAMVCDGDEMMRSWDDVTVWRWVDETKGRWGIVDGARGWDDEKMTRRDHETMRLWDIVRGVRRWDDVKMRGCDDVTAVRRWRCDGSEKKMRRWDDETMSRSDM